MSAPGAPSFKTLFDATLVLVRSSWPLAAASFVILACFTVVIELDWMNDNHVDLLNVIASCVITGAGYFVIRDVVRSPHVAAGGVRLFARYFLLSILVTMAVGLGLIFLIVPGLIIGVRWAGSVPALLAEDLTIGEALERSWHAAEPAFWPILKLLALIWGPPIAVIAVASLSSRSGQFIAGTVYFKVFTDLCLVASWYAAAAVYEQTIRRVRIGEVFA